VEVAAWPAPSRAAVKLGLAGSFNSGGGGGRNEAESQPAEITNAASMAAMATPPAAIPHDAARRRVVVVFKDRVLWLFGRGRWDRPGGTVILGA
jgi:hypothetical protein